MLNKQALLPIFLSSLVAVVYFIFAFTFKDMYKSFDSDISKTTQMILDYPWFLLLLPASVIAGIRMTEFGSEQRKSVVLLSLLITMIIWLFLSWILFAPIIQLGM